MVTGRVDLRSDTVTKPSEAMRAAMANAEVDDDVFGYDPTALRLETEMARLTGKEAAVFVPSGTMGNLISVLVHCEIRGSEVILGDKSHIHIYENGGISTIGGVHPRTVKNNEDGTMDIDLIEAAIRDPRLDIIYPVTRLICLENTHGSLTMDLDVDLLHSANPGPIDGSILVLQQQHRSKKVWDAERTRPDECESMRIRRVESRIRRRKQPSPAVMDLIRRARLEGLCSVPFLSLDWALITALVERWRPETHTFHMRPGELTITLQDVEILLGIPVDGRPVTGTTLINPDDLCLRLLGEAPGERDKKGGKVKLKWLRDRFNGIVEDGAAAEVVARQARGYLLLLLGGTIFADFTGGFVHLSYLQLLENFDVAGEYSWGSGALSVLYRNLCHGAKIKSKQMTGPFVLVQIWAWERFPYLAPGRRGKRAPQPGAPLLGRWDDDFHSPDLATHVVGAYRHHLDIQRDDEVNWTPYSDEVVESLPHYCRAGKAIWRATVPLIFYSFVEYHQPERVLRQFGFRQGIPTPSRAREWPHGKTLQSGQKDWAIEHSAAVKTWDERMQHVVEAVSPDLPVYQFDDPYVVWYERITRRCISRVGAGIDGAARCFKTLNRSGVPETYRAIGLAGLQHLSALEKFLRLKPPDHHFFEQPATGDEELAQGREESSQQPESQHQATGHDEPRVEGSTCQTEPPDATQPPPSVPIASPYPLLSSYVLSPSMFESPGITPHANSSSSFQPEVSWEHLEVFDFSPGGISYDSLVEAKRRRIGESNLGDVGVSLGDGVVTHDGESTLGDVGMSLGDGVVTHDGESTLGDVGMSLGDGVVTHDGESNLGDVGVSLGDGVVTQDAVADAQAEDVGIYPNVDEQIVSRETVKGKVTQAATTATPVAGHRKSTRHRKKTHCGTGGTHSSHVGRGKTKKGKPKRL